MKKISLIIGFTIMSLFSNAQVIDNKVNIYGGYGIGTFSGNGMAVEGSFITPSLYPNYNSLSGWSLKGLIRSNHYFSLGLAIDFMQASDWKIGKHIDYINSKAKLYSFAPTIQLHQRFSEIGVFNKLKVYMEVAPCYGFSNLTLTNPLFDVKNENEHFSQIMYSDEGFIGIGGGTGVEVAVSNALGVYLSYNFQHNKISSKLYHDREFMTSKITFGVFARVKKNKRYFY